MFISSTKHSACTYYKQNGKIQKLPVAVTTEEISKSQTVSMSCVNKVSTNFVDKINQTTSNVNNVCSVSFQIYVPFLDIFSKRCVLRKTL